MPSLRVALSSIALASMLGTGVGCSGTEGSPTDGPTVMPEVSVRVLQYRRDEVSRLLVVKVRNTSPAEIRLTSLDVVAPGFDGAGAVAFDTAFPPGRAFDLRVPYGDPECDRPPPEQVGVRIGLEGYDSAAEVDSEDGAELLGRIHESECAIQDARGAVPIEWGSSVQRTGAGEALEVSGVMSVGPVSEGRDVQLVDIEDSALLRAQAAQLPLRLQAGESAALDVQFGPQRCDGHAIGDASKPFEFRMRMRFPGGEDDVLVPVVPVKATQDQLLEALLERCGLD